MLADFDPLKEAGAKYHASTREFTGIKPNADGQIVLKFERGSAGEPEINGIEILPVDHAAGGRP